MPVPAAFSAYAALVLVSRFFLGGLPDRIHPRITFYTGLGCMAVGLGILTADRPSVVAVIGAALLGFGFSFPWASIASTVLRRTPPGEHGSVVSVLSAFYDLFVGMSSFSAGLLANRFGYASAFLMAIAALGAAAMAGRFVFGRASHLALAEIAPTPSRSGFGNALLPNREGKGVPLGLRPTKGHEDALWQIGWQTAPAPRGPSGAGASACQPASSTEPVLFHAPPLTRPRSRSIFNHVVT